MALRQSSGEGFIGRWSRLKRDTVATEEQAAPAAPIIPAPVIEAPVDQLADAAPGADGPGHPPDSSVQATGSESRGQTAPVLPSIESLGRDSDYSVFMKADVDPGLRLSALKKMFTDPHFNQMDGLDIYIDDYTKPDPIPLAMLKKLNQSRMLNLFEEEPEQDESSPTAARSLPAEEPDPASAEASSEASAEAPAEAEEQVAATDQHVAESDQSVPVASLPGPVAPPFSPATPELPQPQHEAAGRIAAAPVANVESPVSGKSA